MFLGLTQLKLRGHLLQAVDASCHQHHGSWVLDSRKLSLGLSHRCQIRNLLRYAEALGVGAAIKFICSGRHDLARLVPGSGDLGLSQLQRLLGLLYLVLEHPMIDVVHLLLGQRWALLVAIRGGGGMLNQLHQSLPLFGELARVLGLCRIILSGGRRL
jgi:hypothetical protein